ncbi:MAG: hypothetical protein HUU55_10405 [Myxococcales bacterium]|nr:hypothetical protein [Myxococcales bacterium]
MVDFGNRAVSVSMVMMKLILVSALLILVGGCATEGGPNGGAAALPNAGILPYSKSIADPLVGASGHDYRRPWIVAKPNKEWAMWITDRTAGADGTSTITLFESPDGAVWTERENGRFVGQTEGWENGWVADPTVTYHNGQIWMWYAAGEGAGVGLAKSIDGLSWERAESNPVFVPEEVWEIDSIRSLSVLRVGETWRLYYVGGKGAGVGVAESEDGLVWKRLEIAPILAPSGEIEGTGSSWDRDLIVSMSVGIEKTAAGRTQFRMWYSGARERTDGTLDVGIGFAGSFDGTHFETMAENPVLRDGGYGETDPQETKLLGMRVLIYSEFWKKEGINRHVIRLATHSKEPMSWPPGTPTQ